MGFFNILETFFFISLAITFVLIMMLVYHFKGRISILEQKCDTMFEIMNNVVKEMRTIKMSSISCVNPSMIVPNNETIMFQQRHNLGELFQQQFYDEEDEDEDEDDDYEDEPKKIVVSDTEYEDEEQPVKIINIEFNEEESNESIDNLEELEEETISLDDEVEVDEVEVEDVSPIDIELDDSLEQSVDYKKMDISYLRTMVITRGLATDTKKMKKGDLIKLLEDSKE